MAVPEIDVDEAARRHAEGIAVIDVREPYEYEEGHMPGARLIPLAEVPDRLSELPTHEPVLVICKTGARSLRAAELMTCEGIDATNILGGTVGWIESGRIVVDGPDPE